MVYYTLRRMTARLRQKATSGVKILDIQWMEVEIETVLKSLKILN